MVVRARAVTRARGMSLAETLVAIVVASVLLAAIDGSLLAGRRYARFATATRGVRQNLRAGAAVLRAELEPLGNADLVAVSDSSIVIRALRGFGVVCAPPAANVLLLDDSTLRTLRTIDPTKDSVAVLRDGNALAAADDRWVVGAVTLVRRGSCASGGGATAITVAMAAADFAGIGAGAPARIFEIDDYRRYKDATGAWWLGVRNPSASGWSASSPVAGPLAGRGGLHFTFLDRRQALTLVPDCVATIQADLKMLDPRAFPAPGRAGTAVIDSLSVFVSPRSR